MKIIFMGTPDFAVPTLSKLINSKHEISAVFTQAPKPKDRGMEVKKSPIHLLAEANNISVYTPKTLRTEEITNLIKNIEADIIIVVAYGFIIPKAILEAKKYGCLNLHPSALPRFRGAAPLQRTIMAGDASTEICIMQMDEGLDTGDILLKKELLLDKRITLPELHEQASLIGSELMLEVLANIDNIKPVPQKEEGLIYAPKLTKAESLIDWNEDAFKIDCKIRGMNPWHGVYFKFRDQNIKILEAEYINIEHNQLPGTILSKDFTVACNVGAIKLVKLQKPGKTPIKVEEFISGCKININEIL